MKSLCGLSYVVLTFFGAINMKRVLGFLFGVVATLWMAAPAAAWTLNDSEEPGSVLVFPKFEVGTRFTPDQRDVPRTTFVLSVTCPKGSTCDKTGNFDTGQKVHLKGNWVCPPDKEIAGDTTCRANDFPLETTVFGTLVFNPDSFATKPPCTEEGYLIVWVVDEAARPIKFDGLIGHEVHRDFDATAHALNALPIQAAEWLNTGDLTDGNSDGNLAFDGNEYKSITGTVFGDVQYDSDNIKTGITLLTLDVKANVPNDPTDVGLNFFGEKEQYSSTATSFTCWKEIEAD